MVRFDAIAGGNVVIAHASGQRGWSEGATVSPVTSVTLRTDELGRAGAKLRLDSWPRVLGVDGLPRRRATAVAVNERVLAAAEVLATADRWLSVVGTGTRHRSACLARSDNDVIWAVRESDRVMLTVSGIAGADDLAARLCGYLGDAATVDFPAISVPSNEWAERSRRCCSAHDYFRALCAVGTPGPDAARVGAVLGSCTERIEVALIRRGAERTRPAVTVYDSPRGRVMLGANRSQDGHMWTTLSTVTRVRLRDTIASLLDSPGHGAMA